MPMQNTTSPFKFPNSLLVPVWVICIFIFGHLITDAASIFLWILCSFFLFAFLDPLLQKLNRRGMSPLFSSIVLVGLATLAIAGLLGLAFKYIPSMINLLKTYQGSFFQFVERATKASNSFLESLTSHTSSNADTALATDAAPKAAAPLEMTDLWGSNLLHGLGAALTIFTFAIMCPVLTFFMIADRGTFAHVFGKAYSDPETGRRTWNKICAAISAYFVGNLIIGVITWPIFALIFYFFGVSSPLLLAVIASVLNLIPFLGSVLSGFIPVLDLLMKSDGIGVVLGLAAICIFIHFAIANFVTPKVLGSKLELNATSSTIALIVWGEMWGSLGLLLAIPITAIIKILLEESGVENLRWIASFMSESRDNMLKLTSVEKDEKAK